MKRFLAFIGLCFIFASSYSSASAVRFSEPTFIAQQGQTFTAILIGENFFNSPDGGGANLTFDPAIVKVNSVTVDMAVWGGGVGISNGTIDNIAGTVTGILVNTFSDVGSDFNIAAIEFEAIGSGAASIIIGEYAINPWASGGSVINPLFIDSSVESFPENYNVPIPNIQIGLFALLLGWVGRRKYRLS